MKKHRISFLACLVSMAVAAGLAGVSYGEGLPGQPAPSVMPPKDRPVAYECPRTKYINCMPPIQGEARALCAPEYLKWVKAHCPGVEVVY